MNNSSFIPLWDTNLFHLGKLCDRKHDYHGTGQSLRIDPWAVRGAEAPKDFKPCKRDCYQCLIEQFEQELNSGKYFLAEPCKNNHLFKNTHQTLYRHNDSDCNGARAKSGRYCMKCGASRYENPQKSQLKTWKVADLIIPPSNKLIPVWDESKYFLGKLCLHDHEYVLSKQSLRSTSGSKCLECLEQKNLKRQDLRKLKKEPEHIKIEITRVNRLIARRLRVLETNLQKEISALEYDLTLAHQDPIAFHQRLKFREQDLRYSRSAKGKQRDYRRRSLESASFEKYTDEQLWQRLSAFEGKCAYCCRYVFNQPLLMSWDHVHPLSKGGADTIENIVPCCKRCNSSKKDCDAYKWFAKQRFFNPEQWVKVELLSNVKYQSI